MHHHEPEKANSTRPLIAIALAFCIALVGCSDTREGRLTVSTASSLAPAFAEIIDAFEADNPGVEIDLNIAGSTRLSTQILEGAPVDVFASASVEAMDHVVELVEGTGEPVVFASNRLAIAVPKGNPAGVEALTDFEMPSLLTGACASAVPCGTYADEVFAKAGVVPRLDTREPDVGSLVLKIELGELDAGIVYRSDIVRPEAQILGIDIPDEFNVVAEYPIVTIGHGDGGSLAGSFVAMVLSDEGRAILMSYGFDVP